MSRIHPTQINKDSVKKKLKQLGYVLFLVPALLPAAGYWMWSYSNMVSWMPAPLLSANLYAWLPVLVMYLLIPLGDLLIGKDSNNPDEADVTRLSQQRYYKTLVLLTLPVAALSLAAGLWMFTHWAELGLTGKLGLILSFGTVHSGIMINAAHELIHKPTRHEQRVGGILLSMVLYPSFKIEHVRGHHVNVATPADHSTSKLDQSLYHFLATALLNNVRTGWQLETQLLRKRKLKVLSWQNELVRWYTLVAALTLTSTLMFGWTGLLFFIAQGFVAISVLETVNYLEHYGLKRRKLATGRYERTTHQHSWNSNYLLSNIISFQLQRHSDHHANPQRRYQVLRHFDDSPQLPAGYSAMIVLAMIPPLWMRVMNPRVRRYYASDSAGNTIDDSVALTSPVP
ncbi:MAG: alkane 1-monooxygenase [Gammaproteobacteria bacterium]